MKPYAYLLRTDREVLRIRAPNLRTVKRIDNNTLVLESTLSKEWIRYEIRKQLSTQKFLLLKIEDYGQVGRVVN